MSGSLNRAGLRARAARRVLPLLLVGAGLLTCRRGPEPPVQALVDAYVPGFRLGSILGKEVRRRYHLAIAPYLGYVDSGYFGPTGLRVLSVKIDQYVDDGARIVSPGARVEWVSMVVATPSDAKRIEERVREALGDPEETCFRGLPRGRRVRSLYWAGPGGAGARLVIPRDAWQYREITDEGERVVPDRATLALGIDRPPPPSLQTEPCVTRLVSRNSDSRTPGSEH
jgi:hypothetical protein